MPWALPRQRLEVKTAGLLSTSSVAEVCCFGADVCGAAATNFEIQRGLGCFSLPGEARERRVALHRPPALTREADVAWALLRQQQPHPHPYRKPQGAQLRVRRHGEDKAVCVCNFTARSHRPIKSVAGSVLCKWRCVFWSCCELFKHRVTIHSHGYTARRLVISLFWEW